MREPKNDWSDQELIDYQKLVNELTPMMSEPDYVIYNYANSQLVRRRCGTRVVIHALITASKNHVQPLVA